MGRNMKTFFWTAGAVLFALAVDGKLQKNPVYMKITG